MDLRTLRYFVAVAEELHFGRAAARLHMSQPPLSRAIRQLETELGSVLLLRSPAGVTLTAAGAALYDEARALLAQAEQARAKVRAIAASATLTLGTLGDSAEQVGADLVSEFRRVHPDIRVRVREFDFTDPTAGLRAGLTDLALTRTPFEHNGIAVHPLRSDPIGVIVREDDPLAGRERIDLRELADRQWFRLPEGTDPVWQAYWTQPDLGHADGPVVRTVHECMQAVLWNGSIGLAPLVHTLPRGLRAVPIDDAMPSHLVVAWPRADTNPLIESFRRIAAELYRTG
ncbi:LysR family transcriptional regulator [Nocardia sp. NPDC056000]|uniref:LysR family transcriptional regulator n=1 Tax=Nocardia sp. NPDC056000 TaxID=3345674 RepID=UPI0035D80768